MSEGKKKHRGSQLVLKAYKHRTIPAIHVCELASVKDMNTKSSTTDQGHNTVMDIIHHK